jgi:hypothetical protein
MINLPSLLKNSLISILITLIFSNCAVQPKLQGRSEWLSATTRNYEGVNKEDVLEAAEYLLRLADGNDFSISHQPDSLQARRDWISYILIFAGFGTDYWEVKAVDLPNGDIKTTVVISTQSQSSGITEISVSGGTPSMSPSFGDLINNPIVYKLFWSRMDYLLGKADRWLTCGEASKKFNVNNYSDGMEVLCNPLNINDNRPSKRIKSYSP